MGHLVIIWTKGNASSIEVWANRTNDNYFVLWSIYTKLYVTDLSPLPAGSVGARWEYKAIYRLDDNLLTIGTISLLL